MKSDATGIKILQMAMAAATKYNEFTQMAEVRLLEGTLPIKSQTSQVNSAVTMSKANVEQMYNAVAQPPRPRYNCSKVGFSSSIFQSG